MAAEIPDRKVTEQFHLLVDGVHGGTSASTEHERVELITRRTRFLICEGDRRLGMCELGADMERSLRGGPDAQP